MIRARLVFLLTIVAFGCKTSKLESDKNQQKDEFTIAFGSCNKHDLTNNLWDDIRNQKPDIWIWGGDNIYADTSDVSAIASMYDAQNEVEGYQKLREEVPALGVWDDHDYGLNDGGEEWTIKEESQQAFLDFMDVPENSPRRTRKGIYTSHDYELGSGRVKLLMLDTRYFRSPLTPDPSGVKRYIPNTYGEGKLLGDRQWQWLENELRDSEADFNIVVSSIQFLSDEHGFETWGNFPHEVDRLKDLILVSGAQRVIILSGDRHISEFSLTEIDGVAYPLIDFTSSGLTHAYRQFSGEPNKYRQGEVVATESFGIVRIDLNTKRVRFEIVGDGGELLGILEQSY